MAFILPTCVERCTRAIKINVATVLRHEKCGEHKLQFNATTSTAQETLLLEENKKCFRKLQGMNSILVCILHCFELPLSNDSIFVI